MNILMTSTANPYVTNVGGKHIHQKLLENGLKQNGNNVFIAYPDGNQRYKCISLKKIIYKLTQKNLLRYKYHINCLINQIEKKIDKIISSNRVDIIHAHDVMASVAARAFYNNEIPIILTIHGYLAREQLDDIKNYVNNEEQQDLYSFLFNIEREGISKANHIIAVDSRIKNYIMKEFGVNSEKISIMYNAVDTNTFSPVSKEEILELRKKLNLPIDKIVILVPRRLVKKNGVIYAIKAMNFLKTRNIYVVIAGDGPERNDIMEEIDSIKLENVKLLGSVDHDKITNYYKAADIILVPSILSNDIEEATSLSMLEGMACGKVVICTDIGGMKEVIKDRENGILIKPESPESISKAVNYVLENFDNLESLRINARNYCIVNHSYLSHAKKVQDIYLKVLRERGQNYE